MARSFAGRRAISALHWPNPVLVPLTLVGSSDVVAVCTGSEIFCRWFWGRRYWVRWCGGVSAGVAPLDEVGPGYWAYRL